MKAAFRYFFVLFFCMVVLACGGGDDAPATSTSTNTEEPAGATTEYTVDLSSYIQYRTFQKLPGQTTRDRYYGWLSLRKDGLPVQGGDIKHLSFIIPGSPDEGEPDQTILPQSMGFKRMRHFVMDCITGPCTLPEEPMAESGYWANFGNLSADTYRIEMETYDGKKFSGYLELQPPLALPVIRSGTMQSAWSIGGDLALAWLNPTSDPNWQHVDEISILIYDGAVSPSLLLSTRVNPATDVFIIDAPDLAALQEQLDPAGPVEQWQWRLWTRAFDANGMNYAAGYSETHKIAEPRILPEIVWTLPIDAAVDVSTRTSVKAAFSIPMDEFSITAETFTLRDAANAPIAAAVSYDSANRIATLVPDSPLAVSTAYTVTILGGPEGVKDIAENPMSVNYSWSFTTSATAAPVALTIWTDMDIPASSQLVMQACQAGVKFQADTDGSIIGLRFYQKVQNSGYVGNLWTEDGTFLASVPLPDTPVPGWHEVLFSSPIPITSGTIYIATYYSPVGILAQDPDYFANEVYVPPLRVPANGGIFGFGNAFSGLESTTANYWVDVMFSATASTTPDTTVPIGGYVEVSPH